MNDITFLRRVVSLMGNQELIAENRSPLFSICTPIYNCKKYLPDLFLSLKSQLDNSWELILVDDCSSDGLVDYLSNQPLIPADQLLYLKNDHRLGPFSSRRRAINAACGEYVICIDADDTLISNHALLDLRRIVECSSPDVIMFNMTRDLNSLDHFINYSAVFSQGNGFIDKKDITFAFINSYKLNNLASKAIRRPLFSDFDEINLVINEDRFEFSNIISKAQSFYLHNKPIYYYRINSNSTTERLLSVDHFKQIVFIEEQISLKYCFCNDDRFGQALCFLMSTDHILRSIASSKKFGLTANAVFEVSQSTFFKEMLDIYKGQKCPIVKKIAFYLLENRFIKLCTFYYLLRSIV